MVNKIKLTIVIPTFNEEKDISQCLNSIAKQDFSKSSFEVIVVDNFSTDNTIKIVESYYKKIQIKIIKNPIKDAEVSKMLGYKKARGDLFMYLDADMVFADPLFIRKMLSPFSHNKKIAGNFVRFLVNKDHPTLTRTLSYDEFQRDPILKFFTVSIKDALIKKNKDYWLCYCDEKSIPPQGLMIYKRNLISNYVKNKTQLIDNEIPAVLVDQGQRYFAFVPSTGVQHLIIRSLKELWRKRIRNLRRTYFPNQKIREFKWINWKKDWPKIGIWLIYTNFLIFPIITALLKSLKTKDLCFLNEPMLNIVSTYSIIFGILTNKLRK